MGGGGGRGGGGGHGREEREKNLALSLDDPSLRITIGGRTRLVWQVSARKKEKKEKKRKEKGHTSACIDHSAKPAVNSEIV